MVSKAWGSFWPTQGPPDQALSLGQADQPSKPGWGAFCHIYNTASHKAPRIFKAQPVGTDILPAPVWVPHTVLWCFGYSFSRPQLVSSDACWSLPCWVSWGLLRTSRALFCPGPCLENSAPRGLPGLPALCPRLSESVEQSPGPLVLQPSLGFSRQTAGQPRARLCFPPLRDTSLHCLVSRVVA